MDRIAFGVVAGLLCLGVVAGFLARFVVRRRTWSPADARVRRVRGMQAQLTFLQAGGRQRTAVRVAWPGVYRVGRTIRLRHDPANPFRTQVEHPVTIVAGALALALLAALGVLFLVLAVRDPAAGPGPDTSLDVPWYVAMAVGLVAIALGGGIAARRWGRRHWLTARATVTAVRKQTVTSGSGTDATTSTTYRITYEFTDDVREQARHGSLQVFHRYGKGEPVQVRYDPADPDTSEVMPPGALVGRWLAVAALLAIGVVFVTVGFLDVAGESRPSSAPATTGIRP